MARILVIDDDPRVRDVLRRMLEYEGFEVSEAEDGAAGLGVCRAEPMDLVITDILMPRQEGIETIITLRREFPATKVIAISGGGTISATEHLTTAGALGAHLSVAKPFTREQILEAVNSLLSL